MNPHRKYVALFVIKQYLQATQVNLQIYLQLANFCFLFVCRIQNPVTNIKQDSTQTSVCVNYVPSEM